MPTQPPKQNTSPSTTTRRQIKAAEQKPELSYAMHKISRKPVEFNETQEIFIDALSEMLIHGGPNDSMDLLISAVLTWYSEKTWAEVFNGHSAKFEQFTERMHAKLRPEWTLDLQIAARANRRLPEAEQQPSTDISIRLRQSVRTSIEDLFRRFLRKATTVEMYLLRQVLQIHDGAATDADKKPEEICLAYAFDSVITGGDTYIVVPQSIMGCVQQYVDALRAAEGKDVE